MRAILSCLWMALIIVSAVSVSAGPRVQPRENNLVADIRILYQSIVKNRTAGRMICDRYERNSGKVILPGTGAVSYRVSIWRFDENLWQNVSEGPMPKGWIAHLNYSNGTDPELSFEFLFDDKNNVVFFYQSTPKSSEKRYYFTAGKLMRVIEGNETVDRPAAGHEGYAAKTIMETARQLKNLRMPFIYMR